MKEQIRVRTKVERDGELGERESLKESERERVRERLSVTEMRGKHGMGLPIPVISLSVTVTVTLTFSHCRPPTHPCQDRHGLACAKDRRSDGEGT